MFVQICLVLVVSHGQQPICGLPMEHRAREIHARTSEETSAAPADGRVLCNPVHRLRRDHDRVRHYLCADDGQGTGLLSSAHAAVDSEYWHRCVQFDDAGLSWLHRLFRHRQARSCARLYRGIPFRTGESGISGRAARGAAGRLRGRVDQEDSCFQILAADYAHPYYSRSVVFNYRRLYAQGAGRAHRPADDRREQLPADNERWKQRGAGAAPRWDDRVRYGRAGQQDGFLFWRCYDSGR